MTHPLDDDVARSGTFEPIWTLEIQTRPDDTDRILDAIVEVHPLAYGSDNPHRWWNDGRGLPDPVD